jgi:hypothetical protein
MSQSGRYLHAVVCSLLILAGHGLVTAKESTNDSLKVNRLASLCRLWGTLKYFHPYLAHQSINWDSAFVVAAGEVLDSKSTEQYSAAFRSLLASLGNPRHEAHRYNARERVSIGRFCSPMVFHCG